MARLRLVAFDVDGTLAETERDGHRVAFNSAFAEMGYPWHWDEARYGRLLSIAGGRQRIAHFLRNEAGIDAEAATAMAEELHPIKKRRYRALVEAGAVSLRPGIARLIGELREAGIMMGIATTSARESVVALLEHTLGADAPNWFAAMATGESVVRMKPAPDLYRCLLAESGIAAADTVAIEDSRIGVAAARQADLAVLATPSSYTLGEDFDEATAVVDQLGEPGFPCRLVRGPAIAGQWVTAADLEAFLAAAKEQSRE